MSDRFGVIDPSALGTMTVIDVPDPDVILRARMLDFKARWTAADPDYGALYDVESIRFDPARVANQVGTSYELNVRSRVNQAARDTTLAFAFGNNLDGIASRYPGGCPRLAIVDSPRPYSSNPEDWEPDGRYRKRIWLSANAFSTAGSKEAYEFWALSAAPLVRDVTATLIKTMDGPVVQITLLGQGPTGKAEEDDIVAVQKMMARTDIRPLTDIVSVSGPLFLETEYLARVYLYPGPDAGAIEDILNTRLAAYLEAARYLGHDHTQLGYSGVLNIEGITHSAIKVAPVKNIIVDETQFVRVTGTPQIKVMRERLQ